MTTQTAHDQLQTLAQFLVASLLPEDADFMVKITEQRGVTQVIIQTPEQLRGMVIGKSGLIVKSLRQIISAAQLGDPGRKIEVDIAD